MTDSDIAYIRESRQSLAKLALLFNVSRSTIANIKNHRTHKTPGYCSLCKQPLPKDNTNEQ